MKQPGVLTKLGFILIALVLLISSWQPALGDDPVPQDDGLSSSSETKADDWTQRAEERQIVSAGMPIEPMGNVGSDQYGYITEAPTTLIWESASNELPLKYDDQVYGPVDIGFSFPYYENNETQIYISSNGILLFGSNDISFNNRPIPFIGLPNRFIAPFWDDLDVNYTNGGRVYYQASADQFIVIWSGTTRHGAPSSLLTFEAILYSDGDICYQYQSLNGELNNATIGIEDSDGIDGLTYLFNSADTINLIGKRLCFRRPATHHATKVLPTYQGHFTENGKSDFSLDVRNIGSLGTDRFDIRTQSTSPSWSVTLFDSKYLPLKDTDANGAPDTGPLAAGSSSKVIARVTAPVGAETGANTMISFTATSASDLNQKREVKLQVAVPTAFGQAVKNSETGIDLDLIWENNQRAVTLAKVFTGSNLAVATLLDNGYMYLWERNGEKENSLYTDIEYSLISRAGIVLQGSTKLTSNYEATAPDNQISDSAPTLSVSPSGLVGITWKRTIFRASTLETNSNIYFLMFNPANPQNPVLFQDNVTDNSGWWKTGVKNTPVFYRPKIKSTQDGRFVLIWEDKRVQTGGEESNISAVVYLPDGSMLSSPHPITNSVPDQVLFREPGMASLSGNRVMATYSRYDQATKISKPSFQIFNSSGSAVGSGAIEGVNGWLATAAELGNGKILFAWTQAIGETVSYDTQTAYALLDNSTYAISGITLLPTPNGREADYVSASIDGKGYGIITWIDVDLYQYLYYALINPDGSIRTPVITFEPVGLNSALVINDSGYSLASYMGSYLTYMPLTLKK